MNPGPSGDFTQKLGAKRQSSAPQISVLPDEFRQVFQKITGGEKVTVKKEVPPATAVVIGNVKHLLKIR